MARFRYVVFLSLPCLVALWGIPVLAAGSGTITALTATNAPAYNQTITITAAFKAEEKINNSNVYYEIIAPDGVTVVATHTTPVPTLNGNGNSGDTFSDSWTVTNNSFPASGTYTLRACWSPGNSQNCNIDGRGRVTTTFFSVPTLGFWLALAGMALFGVFLWFRRADFRRQPQPAETQAK